MTRVSWFIRPNWSSSVKVTYEFKTDIIASRENDEQRRALRDTPRKTIEFQVTALNENDLAAFHRYIATWSPTALLVPEWTAQVRSVNEVPIGETSVLLDQTIPNWLQPGIVVMLWTPDDHFSSTVAAIDTGTNTITLTNPSTIDFPGRRMTKLCAVRSAYFPDTLRLQRALLGVGDGTIAYQVEETSEPKAVPAAAFFVYEGTEVFLETPDWSTPIEEDLARTIELVDAGWGPTKRYSPTPRQVRSHRAVYWRRGATNAYALLDFFLRMKGMRGEFRMPTYERDLFPGYDVAAGDDFLREPGTLLNDTWVRGWPYSVIMIEITNGTRYFRRITGVAAVTDGLGTDSVISFDTPIPDAIALADIVRVSWVPTWRFSSDQMVIEWKSDEVGTVTMAFQTVKSILGDTVTTPDTLDRVIFLRPGTTSWTVPDDLDPDFPAKIEALGAGNGGGSGLPGAFLIGISGTPGAGGAYAVLPALPLTPAQVISVSVPFGGAASTTPGGYVGANPGDTRFGIDLGPGPGPGGSGSPTDLLRAEGGHLRSPAGDYSEGGRASFCIPVLGAFSGGSGGQSSAFGHLGAPGAGGAAGPNGDGGAGAGSAGGANGGGGGGGAADGGRDGSPASSGFVGGIGGDGSGLSAGAGAGGGSGPGGAGGDGGHENLWTETASGEIAGPGSGAGGGAAGNDAPETASDGGDGGLGGSFGGGGGAGGCGRDTTGVGTKGGDALIVITYRARV